MKRFLQSYWPIAVVAAWMVVVLAVTLVPYKGNVTALFHMDHVLADQHEMPKGFVVLDIPSYDGAQYYQIARNVPLILEPNRWPELKEKSPGAYAYQRFLLPLTAFVVALGQDTLLPYAFLLINSLCILGASLLFLKQHPQKKLYAVALGLCPAAMVALHFSLAEPLTILLLTIFLLRYEKTQTVGWMDVLLMSLLILTREVNIVFVVGLMGFLLIKKQWMASVRLLIPVAVFIGWHAVIYGIFHDIPFLWSADKRDLPFATMARLVTGFYGYNRLTLTSIPLALLFVIPGLIWMSIDVYKKRCFEFIPLATMAFFLLMSVMPDHIWGSITSIGRVITPVYPLFLFHAYGRDTITAKLLTSAILVIGIGASVALAISLHPFSLT